MTDDLIDILKVEVATLRKVCADHERENERLVWRLEAARHEARAATQLVLEHQEKNNRLRAALRKIARDASPDVLNPAQYAQEVLGDD